MSSTFPYVSCMEMHNAHFHMEFKLGVCFHAISFVDNFYAKCTSLIAFFLTEAQLSDLLLNNFRHLNCFPVFMRIVLVNTEMPPSTYSRLNTFQVFIPFSAKTSKSFFAKKATAIKNCLMIQLL